MKKKIYRFFLGILCTISLAGCRSDKDTDSKTQQIPKVELVVWGSEEDTELMNQIIQSFKTEYRSEADFQITFEVQGESQCKDALIGDWKKAQTYLHLQTISYMRWLLPGP